MSYFDFINQSSVYPQQTQTKATSPTINIPVSIADELFATQSLNLDEQGTSNVFASPLYSLTDTKKTSKNNNRLVMSSSTLSSDSNSVNATPRLSGIEIGKRQHLQHNSNNMSDASIFGFINQSNKLDNARLEDLVFTSSSSSFTNQASLSPLNLQTTRPSSTLLNSSSSSSTKTVETQKLLEETKWKQAKAEQQLELDLIHQLYERRRITLNEIKKAQDSIKCSTTEKQKALESEDYEKVDTLDRQGRLLESKRDRLMYDVMESISQQLQTAWVKMADKTQMVKSCASTVVQVYQAYKDERYHQFEQYNMDMKRSHEQFAGEIKDERSTIESSKSELAFDLSYWKQAEMELDQKMVEAVHDKETQKEELMVKIQSTDDEIQALVKKLDSLTQKRSDYNKEIESLDHSIKQDLARYQPEVAAMKKEKLEMDERKQALEQQTMALDHKNAVLQQKMEDIRQYEDRGWKELDDLDKTILETTKESQTMAKVAESILTVLNECISRRDQSIAEQLLLSKKMTDKIQSLQRHVDQQEQEYNRAQRQLDELDTQSHVKKLQRAKLDQWKSKAVEQGQYRDASKWQQDIKRLDVALDEDQQTHSDFENRIHVLGTNLSTSREKLQGLLLDHRTQEQKSVETIIDLLKDSATLLDQHKNTTEIVINKELDSINDWITHYEYYKDNLHSK